MSLYERLQIDLKQAMKQRQSLRVSTLRLLHAALHNREIALGHTLDETEILAVIRAATKQRHEAIDSARQYGRDDIVQREAAELAILESYLPIPLSPGEIAQHVEAIVQELGATSGKDLGRVMQALMPRLQGRAEGKVVSDLVRQRLGNPQHA